MFGFKRGGAEGAVGASATLEVTTTRLRGERRIGPDGNVHNIEPLSSSRRHFKPWRGCEFVVGVQWRRVTTRTAFAVEDLSPAESDGIETVGILRRLQRVKEFRQGEELRVAVTPCGRVGIGTLAKVGHSARDETCVAGQIIGSLIQGGYRMRSSIERCCRARCGRGSADP